MDIGLEDIEMLATFLPLVLVLNAKKVTRWSLHKFKIQILSDESNPVSKNIYLDPNHKKKWRSILESEMPEIKLRTVVIEMSNVHWNEQLNQVKALTQPEKQFAPQGAARQGFQIVLSIYPQWS